jgi:adenylosuccinate lyase
MTIPIDFNSYLSPFAWRYGSPALRLIWSEVHKRFIWRKLWVALANAESQFGIVTQDQVADLQSHMENIDVERSLAIENEINHDLMAEIRVYAEQCPVGGGIIHLGATSMDIKDNADVIRMCESLDLLLPKLTLSLRSLCEKIEQWAGTPIMGYTHLQPAEPTTLGYRLASYAQDLYLDWENLYRIRSQIKGKGFKGAVGTSASYAELIGIEHLNDFENRISDILGLPFYPIVSQIYPRKQDYLIASALAGLGASLYKFAFDLRLLQSPAIGEISEPFGYKQVGSSAMPFKRNPINAEKINSLARALAQYPRLAWDNEAQSLLEITLDDSANRRTYLPEMFLICDELLQTFIKIFSGLRVNEQGIRRNMDIYGPFASIERVLMAVCKAGADRQEMHERLRIHSLAAWEAVENGLHNPLMSRIRSDQEILKYIGEKDIPRLMDASSHVGDAAKRARAYISFVRTELDKSKKKANDHPG